MQAFPVRFGASCVSGIGCRRLDEVLHLLARRSSSTSGHAAALLESSSPGKSLDENRRSPCVVGVAHARTKGRPGGKQPLGNLAFRSPALSLSAASRKATRKRP